MPAIVLQQKGSTPQISSATIQIPDDKDFGTGTFITVLVPNALKAGEVITSTMYHLPYFHTTATVNPNGDVAVLLARADGSSPPNQRTFLLPRTPRAKNVSEEHELSISFVDWNITSASLDGDLLEAK